MKFSTDPPGPPQNPSVSETGRTWALVSWLPPSTDRGNLSAISKYVITALPQAFNSDGGLQISSETGLLQNGRGSGSNSSCVEVECETHVVEVPGNETTSNLTGLVPALQYTLAISAFSNGSRLQSAPSESTTFTTLLHGRWELLSTTLPQLPTLV